MKKMTSTTKNYLSLFLFSILFIGLTSFQHKNDKNKYKKTSINNSFNCEATLVVNNNRHFRSVDKNGTVYSLILTNKSSQAQTFSLNTVQLDTDCSNKNKKKSKANVLLDSEILSTNSKRFNKNQILITAGDSFQFKVKIAPPSNVAYNSWSCIKILAKNNNCKNETSTVLSVYVPNPNEK